VTFCSKSKSIPGAKVFPSVEPIVDMGIQTNVYNWLEPLYRGFRIHGVVIELNLARLVVRGASPAWFRSPAYFWIQAALVSGIFLASFIAKINETRVLSELGFVLLPSTRWRLNLNLRTSISEGSVTSGLNHQ
jgi:hypothetical protein